MFDIRHDGAEEFHLIVACDQQRGKIIDIHVAEQFRVILHVQPFEPAGGKQLAAFGEGRLPVFATGAAPFCAQAHYQQGWVTHHGLVFAANQSRRPRLFCAAGTGEANASVVTR